MHENEGSWVARTRLAELGDSSVDHTWLWRLNPRHGLTLEADEYIDSVRFRLGCAGPVEPVTCAACNSGILDTGAGACLLLRPWRGDTGTQCRFRPFCMQQCSSAITPLKWRFPVSSLARDLRPADILTSALGQRLHCLGCLHLLPRTLARLVLTAHCPGFRPNSSTMGPTSTLSFVKTSLTAQLSGAPTGDLTPDTLAVLRSLSKSIARKRNVASAEVVFHRLHSSITLEIWRRTARQVRACWPTTAPLVELELGT